MKKVKLSMNEISLKLISYGNYNEYNTDQVDLMIKGIRNFISIN
ncbi:hypothetical protein LCGC14_0900700 [marine sediment metagenome]|uniref:Uncharacterized protein n=1 Tax=marine sediment metagenome TaxID=412755 RepID=A0A0F9NWJ4_9ZZZZ